MTDSQIDALERKFDQEDHRAARRAAMAKLNATALQNKLLDEFLQLHGGYGYMTEYGIGPAWVDARIGRIYGGSDEIMKEIIARGL